MVLTWFEHLPSVAILAQEGVLLSKYSEYADPAKGANGPMVDLRDSGFLMFVLGCFLLPGCFVGEFLLDFSLAYERLSCSKSLEMQEGSQTKISPGSSTALSSPFGLLVVSYMSLQSYCWSPTFYFTELLLEKICV